jgi:hypothetical protein
MLIIASLFISGLMLKGLKILFTNVVSRIDQYYEVPIELSSNKTEYAYMFSVDSIDYVHQADLADISSGDKSNTNLKKLLNDVPDSDLINREKGRGVFMPARFHQIA